jgi:hypothetical protein
MARVQTVVTLDKKEMDDLLVEGAKKQLEKCVGSASIEYICDDSGRTLRGALITFSGTVRT